MASRLSDEDDLAYGERWDGERLAYEGGRFKERDRLYTRLPTQELPRQTPRERIRDSAGLDDRFVERRAARPWEDHRLRERGYFDESPRRRPSPPPELERRIYLEKKDREYRDSSPVRSPPPLLRRQSSLDTFDRRPAQRLHDHDRDEYVPPVRRREHRPEPYEPVPLPRSRALPPPRVYAEDDYEEIRVPESHRYEDEDLRAYPERFREREIVHVKKHRERSGSRTSRARRYHSSSRRSSSLSSPPSSSSSDTGGTAITTKSEYPKKGKTKIPIRLVSIRAIAELQYPHVIEGNTVIIQKALGQKNIDDLLKLSDDYKRADAELTAARSISGAIVEERKEEIFTIPPPPVPVPPAAPSVALRSLAPPSVEVTNEALVREVSPLQAYTSYNVATVPPTNPNYLAPGAPVVVDTGLREVTEHDLVGPLTIVGDRRIGHHSRHRSRSRGRELVRTERLATGELVVYEEEIERIEEPRRGVRIEKDKKGRMTISVPKHRK
ncbi:hypothetical protein GGR50DRAFT_416303 [Xylaria sp. CBS 124048]|nr:hypothetical protein GGR50DRAFT_416303 [Xylaria sp. CBS 124048]